MSLLTNIINNPGSDSIVAKQLAYLINIVRQLGWDSLADTRTIKPNIRRCLVYIRKHKNVISTMFPDIICSTLNRFNLVNIINPILIHFWHVQIIGSMDLASLERLLIQK